MLKNDEDVLGRGCFCEKDKATKTFWAQRLGYLLSLGLSSER